MAKEAKVKIIRDLVQAKVEMDRHLTSLNETYVERDEAYTHCDRFVVEKEYLLVEKAPLESRQEVIPTQKWWSRVIRSLRISLIPPRM